MRPPDQPIRFLLSPSLGEVKEHVRAELFSRALSQRLGRPVIAEVATSYEALERALLEERVELVWGTAEQCTAFEPRARVVLRAVRAGRGSYHSALICRASEPLTLDTLEGTRAAWVAPRSTAGHLMPVRYLRTLGHEPARLFREERFFGTYRKALLALLAGEADVAALYSSHAEEDTVRAYLAEHVGEDERLLTPFAYTHATPADGLIITPHLPEEDTATLVAALTSIAGSTGGLEPLLGLFDSEGFVHSARATLRECAPTSARQTDYLAVELDAHQRCLRAWSPSGSVFRRSAREMEGRPLGEALGLSAGGALEALARAARHGGGGRVEYRVEVEGQTRWFAAEASAQDTTTAVLVRDVTELRAQEQALYGLASFPLLHPEPMLELGPRGELRYANPAAHRAFGDLIARGPRHPLVEAALAAGQRPPGGDTPRMQHQGRHWELTVTHLMDPDGLRVFAKDVTARMRMEAQLFKADRLAALGTLAGAVGHEMGNPLAYMLANLGFAREELTRVVGALRAQDNPLGTDVADVLEALTEAADGAERLKSIVQDLRMLSRAPPEQHKAVDILPVLEHALNLVRVELRHRARLETDFREAPRVEGDESRLSQVFVNLLLNALQAMDEARAATNVLRVSVSTGAFGELVVEVRDTGRGMSPEVLAHIFEPFFTTRATGTGLGLSVSHALVTGLGGTLRAESREGEGSLLTVTLPAARPDDSLDLEPGEELERAPGGK